MQGNENDSLFSEIARGAVFTPIHKSERPRARGEGAAMARGQGRNVVRRWMAPTETGAQAGLWLPQGGPTLAKNLSGLEGSEDSRAGIAARYGGAKPA